ncbi:anhydro-N-acetylmuramic acid kinase [Agromyces atrinae]|uniref:anhydro-N-acetylmuramic acid kinase n=1 Tax=Agromyces atrinae TaxID=592376 RepID=UPI001F59A62B|nr:anhydro-N-acetylmuramic acid kinase [Agromyces atrinae]MCI2957188.1 anhydro-N-acetylmuramic acid kinase [Agromyces atrinae]
MRILGMISGTSHDGIDVAVVDLVERDGTLELALRHRDAVAYEPDLRSRIIAALPPASVDLAEVCALDTLIGQAFAEAAAAACDAAGAVDLIVSHGQTVFHWVEGDHALGTLQLGQPAWIAERTGVAVVSDVRSRDIAAGGHGAPLASTIDALLLAGRPGRPAALNLGGISNATVVDPESVRAWDIGPANALLDAVIVDRSAHPAGYDDGGALAAAGTVDEALLAVLLEEPYYRVAPPKSTGKELFHLDYVNDALRRSGREDIATNDLLATLARLTIVTVAEALVADGVTEIFVSGGGAHNPVLLDGIAELTGATLAPTDALGLPGDDKEAVLMAVIGWMTVHGVPSSIPTATGARGSRLLGSITPGARPLAFPAPVTAPTALRVVD